MAELQNVIFDMGQVLLKFTPDGIFSPFFPKKEDLETIKRVIFDSGDWVAIDTGLVSEEEMVLGWIRALPQHEEAIRAMMATWYRGMEPVEGMTELVAELKEAGYGCYLLSNTSARFFEYVESVPSLRMMDGYLISAVEKLIKPDPAIFVRALERFGLRAEECCFVDDNRQNTESAAACGIRGICFENYDVAALRHRMRAEGIKIKEA